jgi:glycosyltransferase involved in cell wall biosynthesis
MLVIFLLKNRNLPGFICIGNYSLFKVTDILWRLARKNFKNISIFVVGGIFDKLFTETGQKVEVFNHYKSIYVESNILKSDMENIGLKNVRYITNYRPIPHKNYPSEKVDDKRLKCVFLSGICEDKGVFKIFEAAKLLDLEDVDYIIDFYGPVEQKISQEFNREIDQNEKTNYMGTVKSFGEEIYRTLDKYDVLLFPTMHSGEGMPGIIVESRIVGIPIIASKWKYSEELIENDVDGIILAENNAMQLKDAIYDLYKDRKKLKKLSENSKKRAANYYIETNIYDILK